MGERVESEVIVEERWRSNEKDGVESNVTGKRGGGE